MATDIKLTASLDQTQVMSGIHEIRSQLGMALGSATGFTNAAMAMAGSPNMGGSGFGNTFTDARMAYSPHYGQIHAQTTQAQEQAVAQRGLAAAQELKPPGVSPAGYALAAMENSAQRDVMARHEAGAAARATFYTSVGGLAAGAATSRMGAWAGAKAGGALGARLFGPSGAAAGAAAGGLAGMWFGFNPGMDFANEKIGGHFASVEQIGGVTKELGELAGGGRGLGREQRYDLGIAARKAAGDLKMDVQQMGDVLALGRESGMMPSSTDPNKAREQYRNFARAIEEGAQVLGTSLAGATQVIKQASQQGMSASQGITQAAGAGGADQWLAQQSRMNAFGAAGMSAGRNMGFTGAQGRSAFMGGLGGAGLSGEETKILGGRFGVAAGIGQAQMAMAASPIGDMQLMAAMGGHSGGSMMDMAGAAIGGLTAGGDDLMTGAAKFMIHKNEYRRGVGPRGLKTMARDQLRMGGEMLQNMGFDGLSTNEAQRMFAQSMGMDPDRAKALVGGGGGGGGGGGRMSNRNVERAMTARMESRLGSGGEIDEAAIMAKVAGQPTGLSFDGMAGDAVIGAAATAVTGGGMVVGAAVSVGIGLAARNYGAVKSLFTEGPSAWADADVKADYYRKKAYGEIDRKVAANKKAMGVVETGEGAIRRFIETDLSTTQLNFDTAKGVGKTAVAIAGGLVEAAGLEEVDAGLGTTQIRGKDYRTSDIQELTKGYGQRATKKEKEGGAQAAFAVNTAAASRFGKSFDISVSEGSEKGGLTLGTRTISDKAGLRKLLQAGIDDMGAGGQKGATGAHRLSLGLAKFSEMLGKDMTPGETTEALAIFTGRDAGDVQDRIAEGLVMAGTAALEGREEQIRGDEADVYDRLLPATRVSSARAEAREDRVSSRAAAIREASRETVKNRKSGGILAGGYTPGSAETTIMSRSAAMAQARSEDRALDGDISSEKKLRGAFTRALVLEGERTNLGGISDSAKKQKQFDRNYENVVNAGGGKWDELGLGSKAPSLSKEYRRDHVATTIGKGIFDVINPFGGKSVVDVVKGVAKDFREGTKTTADAELVRKATEVSTGKTTKKFRKKGGGTLQRAAGFGQRESAMDTINKSLRHTERALKDTRDELKRLNTVKANA